MAAQQRGFFPAQFDSNFIVLVKKIESFAFEVEDKMGLCDCAMQALHVNTWLAGLSSMFNPLTCL